MTFPRRWPPQEVGEGTSRARDLGGSASMKTHGDAEEEIGLSGNEPEEIAVLSSISKA